MPSRGSMLNEQQGVYDDHGGMSELEGMKINLIRDEIDTL